MESMQNPCKINFWTSEMTFFDFFKLVGKSILFTFFFLFLVPIFVISDLLAVPERCPHALGEAAKLVSDDPRLELGLLDRVDVLPLAAAAARGERARGLDAMGRRLHDLDQAALNEAFGHANLGRVHDLVGDCSGYEPSGAFSLQEIADAVPSMGQRANADPGVAHREGS